MLTWWDMRGERRAWLVLVWSSVLDIIWSRGMWWVVFSATLPVISWLNDGDSATILHNKRLG